MRESPITQKHLSRLAYVYVRQSTLQEVVNHKESGLRQYGLRERALALGWAAERIRVVDEDQATTATTTDRRDGFRQMVQAVLEDEVGAIFATDVSRLARQSSAWMYLLEICGLSGVLLIDEQKVCDPRQRDDRLLLNITGVLAEVQIGWMVDQMHESARSKAGRGELHLMSPAGYQWNGELKRLELDPDEQVQSAIRLVFERFRQEASAGAVVRSFNRQGLLLPSRVREGTLNWQPAREQRVLRILKSPLYAGVYVYGRKQVRKALVRGEIRARQEKRVPRDEWPIVLPEKHPAYVSWEEYVANQEKLRANQSQRKNPDERGAPRAGQALLQGLALCGRCGRRIRSRYSGAAPQAFYVCDWPARHSEAKAPCFSVAAKTIDKAVEEVFLTAVAPPELELSLAVAQQVEAQVQEVQQQWSLRLERARYEAQLAERRYRVVDPDNRLVARTLERQWEQSLAAVARVEKDYEEVRRRERLSLDEKDKEEIRALARDLPRVWNAPTTTMADRKNLLRTVIEVITLEPVDVPSPTIQVRIQWTTGAVTELSVQRTRRGRPSEHTQQAARQNQKG